MSYSTRFGAFAVLLMMSGAFARATTIATFSLNQDGCTGTCGTGPFGSVTLIQSTDRIVTVTTTLAANERWVKTGAGNSLAFNLIGGIIIDNLTAGFVVGPSPASASTFGSFAYSVSCDICKGGNTTNPSVPLSFTVTSALAGGVKVSDFYANANGFYFASDIMGNSGRTGNVASRGGTLSNDYEATTPEPGSLGLIGLGVIGLLALRNRQR